MLLPSPHPHSSMCSNGSVAPCEQQHHPPIITFTPFVAAVHVSKHFCESFPLPTMLLPSPLLPVHALGVDAAVTASDCNGSMPPHQHTPKHYIGVLITAIYFHAAIAAPAVRAISVDAKVAPAGAG